MAPEMEKPQVTEIKVRMDCNGCVQKIKKALQGVAGIQGIDVDFPQQKLTITGWAEPEKLVKAIRKTRKSAVICVHTEETGPLEGEEEASPGDGAPQPEPMNQRGETEAAPPGEAQDEQPPLQPENPPPATRQPAYHQQIRPNGAEGVHVVYHHPPDHGYGRPWNAYHVGPGFGDESHQPPPPVYVQRYNTYRPSPHVTEYAYPRPPPPRYSYDTRPNPYSDLRFKEEPPQPQPQPPQPQPSPPPTYTYNARPDHYSGPGFREEPPQPQPQPQPQPSPPPTYTYNARPDHYSGPGFRDEPPQPQQPPPQPVYATHSYNTYKPSPYVTGYAYPQSPSRPSTHIRPDSSWGPGLQGESEQSQPPQPVYATHSQNIYRPSPYVTEYAYPESPPPRYSSFSIPGNYSRDYYGGSHGNGNGSVTSMFSEENPNACRIV